MLVYKVEMVKPTHESVLPFFEMDALIEFPFEKTLENDRILFKDGLLAKHRVSRLNSWFIFLVTYVRTWVKSVWQP